MADGRVSCVDGVAGREPTKQLSSRTLRLNRMRLVERQRGRERSPRFSGTINLTRTSQYLNSEELESIELLVEGQE